MSRRVLLLCRRCVLLTKSFPWIGTEPHSCNGSSQKLAQLAWCNSMHAGRHTAVHPALPQMHMQLVLVCLVLLLS